MRRSVTQKKLREFMQKLAGSVKGPGNVYFTGGATMLLLGVRPQTIDIDLKIEPEPKGVFEAIGTLKEELDLNIELASPDHFIPTPADWAARSKIIDTIGSVNFFHFDLRSQALAKLERGYDQDLNDVRELIKRGFVKGEEILGTFQQIKAQLIRFPAVHAKDFEDRINRFLKELE